jgi:type I restriction enzyme R subunit
VDLSYASVKIQDARLWLLTYKANFPFNETTITAKEFDAILNHLAKGNVFEKTRRYETVFN